MKRFGCHTVSEFYICMNTSGVLSGDVCDEIIVGMSSYSGTPEEVRNNLIVLSTRVFYTIYFYELLLTFHSTGSYKS